MLKRTFTNLLMALSLSGCFAVELDDLPKLLPSMAEVFGNPTAEIQEGKYRTSDGKDVEIRQFTVDGLTAYLSVDESGNLSQNPIIFWNYNDGYLALVIASDLSIFAYVQEISNGYVMAPFDCASVPERVRLNFYEDLVTAIPACRFTDAKVLDYFLSEAFDEALNSEKSVEYNRIE